MECKGISADKPVLVSVIAYHGICDILICERLVAGRDMQWSARSLVWTSRWW